VLLPLPYVDAARRIGAMGPKKSARYEPEVEEILGDPKLLDEWTGRWLRVGKGSGTVTQDP
jgi:hypothetical protein